MKTKRILWADAVEEVRFAPVQDERGEESEVSESDDALGCKSQLREVDGISRLGDSSVTLSFSTGVLLVLSVADGLQLLCSGSSTEAGRPS